MKYLAFFLAILFAGCETPYSVNRSDVHARVLYARDPAHHCRLYETYPAHKEWMYGEGKVVEVRARSMWECDDGVTFGFDEGDEQP